MSDERVKQWAYSYDEEHYHGSFDSKDAAILEAFLNDPDIESVEVGYFYPWNLDDIVKQVGCWDGKRVMEDIHERMLEEACEWAGDHWGDKLLSKETCDKVNNFLAALIMEVEPPAWFEMSGVPETVSKVDWLAEGNTVD